MVCLYMEFMQVLQYLICMVYQHKFHMYSRLHLIKCQKKRVLTVGKTKIEVRKPPVTITKENCRAVEIAELLAQIPEYQIDNYKDRLQEVKKSITPVVSKKILREVITMYPAEVSKKAIQGDLL